MPQQCEQPTILEAVVATELPRLIRLCAALTGDWNAAEDLAQETLVEAWRHRERLAHPEGYAAWLSAIARNVCLRWVRAQGREHGRAVRFAHALQSCTNEDHTLERTELVEVLDHALALLPPSTRMALLARYAEDMSLSEVADKLKMTENAVAVRLHRGKHTLRRLLASELVGEAAGNPWQPTTLWCPYCGAQRLVVNVQTAGDTSFWLRCPDCRSPTGPYFMRLQHPTFQRTPSRVIAAFSKQLCQDLVHSTVCPTCGNTIRLTSHCSDGTQLQSGAWIVGGACYCCTDRHEMWMYHNETALYTPEGLRFWRAHQRIRVLSDQPIEIGGTAAFLTRFASETSRACLEVVALRATCQIVSIHEAGT